MSANLDKHMVSAIEYEHKVAYDYEDCHKMNEAFSKVISELKILMAEKDKK